MMYALLAAAFLVLPAAAQPTQDDLFDESCLQVVRLEMDPADWQTLRENYLLNTFYPATFHWRDQSVERVGVRSRGTTSRNGVKPGLRIDFNRYDKTRLFLGLASVALDNGVQDPSLLRERMAMAVFRRMNIPAPRAVHIVLYVNSDLMGLYILLDRLDAIFLQRQYGDDSGDLYEFNRVGEYRFEYLGEEPEPYADMFDAKNSNADRAALAAMIRDVNQTSDEDFAGVAAKHLDIERFARYLAVENFVADIDGVAGEFGMNNFYLYRHPATRRFEFIPWDKDFSFNGVDHAVGYNLDRNVLTARLMSVPLFRDVYLRTLRDTAESTAGWLEEEVWRVRGMIEYAAYAEPEGDHSGEAWLGECDNILAFAQQRSGWVVKALEEW